MPTKTIRYLMEVRDGELTYEDYKNLRVATQVWHDHPFTLRAHPAIVARIKAGHSAQYPGYRFPFRAMTVVEDSEMPETQIETTCATYALTFSEKYRNEKDENAD